jgi:hypothetical protein
MQVIVYLANAALIYLVLYAVDTFCLRRWGFSPVLSLDNLWRREPQAKRGSAPQWTPPTSGCTHEYYERGPLLPDGRKTHVCCACDARHVEGGIMWQARADEA